MGSTKHNSVAAPSRISKSIIVAITLVFSVALQAAEPEVVKRFQIDLLIYTLLYSQSDESFSLPPEKTDTENTDTENTIALVNYNPFTDQQVQLLSLDNYHLQEEADRLARSRNYSPLARLSWETTLGERDILTYQLPKQIDVDKNQVLSGTLTIALRRYLHAYPNIILSKWSKPEPAMLDTLFSELDPLQPDANRISNTLGGKRSATSNRDTTPPGTLNPATSATNSSTGSAPDQPGNAFDPITPTEQTHPLRAKGLEPSSFYTIKQPRRMRSGELHMFDHPKFGILMKITPIARAPEEATEAQPDNLSATSIRETDPEGDLDADETTETSPDTN